MAAFVAGAAGAASEFCAGLGETGGTAAWLACGGGGVVLTGGGSLFLPHPAINIAAPRTSTSQKILPCVVWHPADRMEPENVPMR